MKEYNNLGFLHSIENPNYVFLYQYLSSNTVLVEKTLQKCVLNDILFHIMIQFKQNFAIKFVGEFVAPNTLEGPSFFCLDRPDQAGA